MENFVGSVEFFVCFYKKKIAREIDFPLAPFFGNRNISQWKICASWVRPERNKQIYFQTIQMNNIWKHFLDNARKQNVPFKVKSSIALVLLRPCVQLFCSQWKMCNFALLHNYLLLYSEINQIIPSSFRVDDSFTWSILIRPFLLSRHS